MTPSRMEPATFQFVAQHLNHCATAVPLYVPTVLQNGLQISSEKKCFMIWGLCGTEFAQTNCLVFITCGTCKGKISFLYKIKYILPQE